MIITNTKFNYKALGGLLNINTLSPNGNYYYRIQKPYSINMSNFGASIAFYNIKGELLYHRNNCIAHWLEPFKNIHFVKWSEQGNMAYFYEFKRNEVYDSVFLDFIMMESYRINELKNGQELVKAVSLDDRNYDENEIKRTILNTIKPSAFYKDEIGKPTFRQIVFKMGKWYPNL